MLHFQLVVGLVHSSQIATFVILLWCTDLYVYLLGTIEFEIPTDIFTHLPQYKIQVASDLRSIKVMGAVQNIQMWTVYMHEIWPVES